MLLEVSYLGCQKSICHYKKYLQLKSLNSLLAPGHHLGKAEVLLMLKFCFNLSFPVPCWWISRRTSWGASGVCGPFTLFFFFFKVWNNRASMC